MKRKMAVDIWLPRLKIANVGRAFPKKNKKEKRTFLSQLHGKYQSPVRFNCPWVEGERFVCEAICFWATELEIGDSSSNSVAQKQILIRYTYTYLHKDSVVFVWVNSRESLSDLCKYRAHFPLKFEHAWRAVLFVIQTIIILMI